MTQRDKKQQGLETERGSLFLLVLECHTESRGWDKETSTAPLFLWYCGAVRADTWRQGKNDRYDSRTKHFRRVDDSAMGPGWYYDGTRHWSV